MKRGQTPIILRRLDNNQIIHPYEHTQITQWDKTWQWENFTFTHYIFKCSKGKKMRSTFSKGNYGLKETHNFPWIMIMCYLYVYVACFQKIWQEKICFLDNIHSTLMKYFEELRKEEVSYSTFVGQDFFYLYGSLKKITVG